MKRGKLGFDERYNFCFTEDGKSRTGMLLDQPVRNLTSKFKIGQQFFTRNLNAEIIRESGSPGGGKLWKSNFIRLF